MQTACWEMPWFRALRAVALMLAVVLGLEWTVPLGGYAQPNQGRPAEPGAGFRAGGERRESGPSVDARGGIRGSAVAIL